MSPFVLVGVLSLFFLLSLNGALSQQTLAATPPRGWNSYDSFCWVVSEEEFLQNAKQVAKRLLPHGYEYVVVDYLWYRRNVPGASTDSQGFDVIDEWGRVIPDPGRWPSSVGGKGFFEVAQKVHDMGLKFGIHIMRGLSTQAYQANTPILDPRKGIPFVEGGRIWRARDIGIKERACAWMPNGFMSVNTSLYAGRVFLRSLQMQYIEWGVDFIKHDCVFGTDLDINEIRVVSEVMRYSQRPVVYSLSPGTSVTPSMAKQVNKLVNMYRVTADDWDIWGHVVSHFDISRDFASASMIGTKGFHGRSWPDLDMLPLGWLTDPGVNHGPYRRTHLTQYEQWTQMTLWAMAKSPIMFGGDVRNLDSATYNLITNPTLLEINSFSSNNKPFYGVTGRSFSGSLRQILAATKPLLSQTSHLSVDSCEEPVTAGWFLESVGKDGERVCWEQKSETSEPFCLYKNKPGNEELGYNKQLFQGATRLVPNATSSVCLDASPRREIHSVKHRGGSLSQCRHDANQMWMLNESGNLVSTYSGLCATMKTVEEKAANSGGIRSWVATGRSGEVYIAFFNLNEDRTLVSARLSDLEMAVPGHRLIGASCNCREALTGQGCSVTGGSISMFVEVHGAALLELKCGST